LIPRAIGTLQKNCTEYEKRTGESAILSTPVLGQDPV